MLNLDAGKIVAVRKKRIIFDLDTAVLDVRNREYTMFSGCVKACGVSSKEYFARRKDGESVRHILRNVCHYGDKEIEGVELALRENANNPDSWAADCLYDGVKNALYQLHDVGFELIAFSLRIDEVAVSAQLRTFGVFDFFKEVVCLGVEKKNTLKALNDKIRLCEKDMIVSGDTYVIKIVPQFKVLSVAVCYGSVGRSCFKELEPDFYVDNIGQLVGWGRLLLEFITGDHPLVNLDCGTPVLHFDLYFPLSSTHAFFMCEKNRLGCYPKIDSLTVQDVDRLNRRLAEGCLKEVYAGRKETLEHGCYKASFDVNSLIVNELNGEI